jgi:uncharacterized protein YqjF (DUF2071 family)
MRQQWHELLFAHWPLPVETMAALVPPGLALDTYEGQAWVGVVPFRMAGVRPRITTAVPWLSAFPELNVRTYVSAQGKPGVFFFSLDAANPVAVWLARSLFYLPYFTARMRCLRDGDTITYSSIRTQRHAPAATLIASYRPTAPAYFATPGSLEHWLTERYCLYAVNRHGALFRGEIHHPQWALQPAEAELHLNTMARASGIILPETAPLLHYAGRQEVLVWPLQRVTKTKEM